MKKGMKKNKIDKLVDEKNYPLTAVLDTGECLRAEKTSSFFKVWKSGEWRLVRGAVDGSFYFYA